VGDYWYKGEVPVCIVLHVEGDDVSICNKVREGSSKGIWEWDIGSYLTEAYADFSVRISGCEIEEDSCVFARKQWKRLTGIDNEVVEEIERRDVCIDSYRFSFNADASGDASLLEEDIDGVVKRYISMQYATFVKLLRKSEEVIND
jgi:hypothetical protein